MNPDSNNAGSERFAPPRAEVADVLDGQTALAGRGTRFAAVLIDFAVQMALLWVVGKVTPWNIFSAEMMNAGFLTLLQMQAVSFVVFLLANGWLLATRGQTIGKMVLSIRIVRRDGSAASAGRAIGLRYGVGWVIYAIPGIGYVYSLVDSLFIFRADRRCVHDLIADTIVVKA